MRDQTNQVYHSLRQRILDGLFRPSESLTEVTLAADLGVSRATIRKALLKLESENLVVIEENKRARVRWFSVEEVMQYLEVRELLEGFVIRQSVPNLSTADLKEMRAILSEMKKCLKAHDLLQYSQNNWRFHDVVYRVCPNRPAVDMVMAIKNQLKRYNIKTMLVQGRGEDSLDEHSKILSALERHDADTAEAQMRRHISNLRRVLRAHFELLL
ncbi:MAG TPA: GntR family transcriptional regulator [Syntrophorhabdales bacterium]|nr:GntR family transcriptional regulator [Syntrophorhabdales bacterium]